MDLDYLRAHPHQLPMFIQHQRIRFTPVGGGSTSVTQRLTFDDGTDAFAKLNETGPAGLLEAERASLDWLAEAGAPVPAVWCATSELLVCEWIEPGEATDAGAAEFGRELARLHRAGAPRFGAPWPGFIGSAAMDNEATETSWPQWFAHRRLAGYLSSSVDNGGLDTGDAAAIEAVMARLDSLAGPPEPIARLHGDLWPGNLYWGADGRGRLIDPAAHGGHRETDLATLQLWGGAPRFDRILTGYQEVWPLAEGWRDRIGLHQLFLLLVHTALFGQQFRGQLMETVGRYI